VGDLRPGKYFIACELNPLHRVLDLPSQYAHQESGLVQLITGNGSEYQKWLIEPVEDWFTIRANVIGGKFIEPLRPAGGADRCADELLLGFYPRAGIHMSEFQHWRFERTDRDRTFYIVNEGTGKYWDLREQDPSHIQQLFRKDMPHQRWILQPAG
jgi:hypothetical protein